jgi:hypothetical protein
LQVLPLNFRAKISRSVETGLIFIVWGIGVVLEATILVRLVQTSNLTKYPCFTAYISCVLIATVSDYIVAQVSPHIYGYWYWIFEFLSVILGYSVIQEIIEKGLTSYKGVRGFARVLGFGTFGVIVCIIVAEWLAAGSFAVVLNSNDVEKTLRTAELVLLASILGVFSYYSVPVGRNLRGIILGYGVVVAVVVMTAAGRAYKGDSFQPVFSALRTDSYLVSLLIWTVALWSVQPNPAPVRPVRLESDYQALALRVRNALDTMRSHLWKAGRP